MNGYELSRKYFNWCFDNPEKVKPIHTAIYFFAIENCNRLGWKQKFGFPSQMVMEAIGVKNWRTYSKGLKELVDFGFIEMIEQSKNQYSSNIIAIVKNAEAPTKALDKALQKHETKQGDSTVSINKQINKEPITSTKQEKTADEIFLDYRTKYKEYALQMITDKIWLESIGKDFMKGKKYIVVGLTTRKYLKLFLNRLDQDKKIHNNKREFMSHFAHWLRKQTIEFKYPPQEKVIYG